MPYKIPENPSRGNLIVVPKNWVERLHLTISEYSGHTFVDIRINFKNNDDWIPTKRGITISPKNWLLFMDGVRQVEEKLVRRGLIVKEAEE